ncbi:hypothetical protein GQR58_006722 [Nymphon striatum]|nr:hypothetical protein GQR58_006722 [Nymphon striatum]
MQIALLNCWMLTLISQLKCVMWQFHRILRLKTVRICKELTYTLDVRDLLLVYFFTAIGLNARLSDLLSGGKPLITLLIITLAYIVFQDVIGVTAASIMGLPKAMGVLTGSASLIGGHGSPMNLRLSKSFHKRLFIIITLGFSLLISACNGNEDKKSEAKAPVIRPVKTITVQASNNTIKKTYSALVTATQQIDLSFRVSGKLEKLPIKNGMQVKKGDVIAKLDERDFKAKITQLKSQINQANAQMKAMRAGARPEDIASLQSAVKAAQAEFNQAKTTYYRTQELVKKQVIARNELDKDRAALEVAKANLASKNQELRKGKAGGRKEDVSAQVAVVQGLRSQLKSLEDALADATLRSPIDGIITSRKVENFANVQANSAIATIQKASDEIDVVFSIPAPDVVILAPIVDQLTSIVVLDSFPGKEFAAEQREFSKRS